jgi:uncharacterized protein (AIM24 family)
MTITNKISGEFAQMVTCQLEPGQSLFADASKFRWKTANVNLETRLSAPPDPSDASTKGGGLLKAALATATEVGKRVLSGQSVAFQWFSATGGSGLVSLAGDNPGQIRALELGDDGGWRAESRAFVCAESTVHYDVEFAGFNQGRRSHNGYILEHFTGSGTLVVGGGGTLVDLNPAAYGGKIQVHGGAIVAFSDKVAYGVEPVGAFNAQTIMSAAFGGQGFNLVTFTGDGPVILQSMLYRELENDDRGDDKSASGGRDALLGRF